MPMKIRVANCFSASILSLATTAVVMAAQPQYEIVNLGVLSGGTARRAYGINNLGQIAGQSNQTGGATVSVLWENNVISRVIDMHATGLPVGYSGVGAVALRRRPLLTSFPEIRLPRV